MRVNETTAFRFVEAAVGGAQNRNKVLTLEEFEPNGYADCYRSMLRFPEAFRAYVTYNEGSVEGYAGESKADFFPTDFDHEKDPTKALEDARRTVRRWEAVYGLPAEALRYYYSGSKGIHLEVPETLFGGLEPGRNTAFRLKLLASEMLKESETADTGIYNTTRLWRAPNTKHRRTGLYKIPLYSHEFFNFDIDQIRKLAQEKRGSFVNTDPAEFEPVADLEQLWHSSKDRSFDEHREHLDTASILDGVAEGERDTILFKLSCKLRGAGIPRDMAERLVLEAAAKCTPPFSEQEARKKVANAYAKYQPNIRDYISDGAEIHSPVTKDEVAGERIIGLFKTAKQCAEETPAEPHWYVRGYVAKGAVTKLDGKIKTAGKTTWITHLLASATTGRPFMGFPTKRTKVIMLTEQNPSSYRQSLKRAGLEEAENIEVLYWRDVIGVPWRDVMAAAVLRAEQIGAGILVVDTVGQFAGIRGDGENSAGEAQNAMQPLQEAAGKGLAVIATYHERKSGGDVGDSGRGSSAFGGAVDIILSLRRGEGNTRENVRVLEGIGRYDETPSKLVIELEQGQYRSLGDTTQYAEQEAMKYLLEILPTKEKNALKTDEVHDRIKAEIGLGKTAIDAALSRLTHAGTVKRLGKGAKGSPFRYYKPDPNNEPEPPLPQNGPPEEEKIHSPATTSYTRENEYERDFG